MDGKQKGFAVAQLLPVDHKLRLVTGLLILLAGVLFSFGCNSEGDPATETGPEVYTVSLSAGGDFTSIQTCIDTANTGDTCRVYAGTYYESLQFWGKAIIVESKWGPEHTILDGCLTPECNERRQVVQFRDKEGTDTFFSGFTVTNGLAQTNPGDGETIENGGGIMILSASPTITNCIITENQAAGNGGGMWIFATGSKPTLINNTFQDNDAGGSGGGLSVFGGAPYLINCIFYDNDAENSSDNGYGGAISLQDEAELTLYNGLIFDNSADHGGAVSAVQGAQVTLASVTVSGNTVTGNAPDISAGAIYLKNAEAELSNSIYWNNRTGAAATDPFVMDYDSTEAQSTTLSLSAVYLEAGIGNIEQSPACVANAANCPVPTDDATYPTFYNAANDDPLFVAYDITDTTDKTQGFYLSQTATGRGDQTVDSPCIDEGNMNADEAVLEFGTTRTDWELGNFDEGTLDLGYHY